MRFLIILFLMLPTFLLTGCNAGTGFENRLASDESSQAKAAPEAPLAAATPGARLSMVAAPAPPNANPSAPATADPASSPATAPHRSIIYNAALALVVPDISAAQQTIQHLATSSGGYLQEIDGPAIAIRVPAPAFDSAIAAIERLGQVTDRHIKANDVTEELRDLRIRLENEENVRIRLEAILAKSDKIEETVRLEQELERVTQSIELFKGKLQFMQDQIAFSTIRINLNSPRGESPATVAALPFTWIKDLADGAVSGVSAPSANADRFWHKNERFRLPTGFVRYFESKGSDGDGGITEAMAADQVLLKVRRHDNYEGGDVAFWSQLARQTLIEHRAIAIQSQSDLKLADGTPATLLTGIKDRGSSKEAYVLGIAATSRYVYTFEAWGKPENLQPRQPALQTSFQSLDIRHW